MTAPPAAPLGIVELVAVCDDMQQRSLMLFRTLGGWVADEPDPVSQRWFAVGSHRHAWHAELWDERRPRIPVERNTSDRPLTIGERTDWYRAELDQLHADLARLEARIDPLLDPSTMRVITLVRNDVADLRTP